MLTVEDNKAIARRIIAVSDKLAMGGDISAEIAELWAPNARHHAAGGPDMDTAGYLQFLRALASGFPHYHHDIEDQIAEGDKVATRLILHGTHTGNFRGIPPTGKQVAIAGINIVRIVGGQVVEAWANADNLGLMQQQGKTKRGKLFLPEYLNQRACERTKLYFTITSVPRPSRTTDL
jgi:predicted ester cyclase